MSTFVQIGRDELWRRVAAVHNEIANRPKDQDLDWADPYVTLTPDEARSVLRLDRNRIWTETEIAKADPYDIAAQLSRVSLYGVPFRIVEPKKEK